LGQSLLIGWSYLWSRFLPPREERTFEQWVVKRFGRRLFETFFKSYTEKVWGVPCSEISADWAQQRIKNLNLMTALKNALLGTKTSGNRLVTSLIERFQYPRLGPGMMWERFRDALEKAGGEVRLGAEAVRLRHDGSRITSVTVRDSRGEETEIEADHVLSSMPLRTLILCMDPPPPREVLDAAAQLRYRDFITVMLVVDQPSLFPDNWIYVHSPEVKVGRIQNFKNWSPEMVPDRSKTSLGLEYFVQEGDAMWTSPDEALMDLARRECAMLGFLKPGEVVEGMVARMQKAYPVYAVGYESALKTIKEWLERFPNLYPIGRNGQHRYNNMDHSMVSALCAAHVVNGAKIDLWDVGVDKVYLEELRGPAPDAEADGISEQVLRSVFARYDGVSLGVALGITAAGVLFLVSAAGILHAGAPAEPTLVLLDNYLFGYSVTWPGALVGALEIGLGAYVFGYFLAQAINLVVRYVEGMFMKQIDMLTTIVDDSEGG
jgi:protoporphyrinogen oxidase